MNHYLKRTILALLLIPTMATGQNEIPVTDSDISAGQNVVWAANNTYILSGFVFVDSSATLTIEAGTVIKGMPGQGENASALIVARGGKIYAEGTAQNPIIFTAFADDVNDLTDLPLDARGLWGGLILLGNAQLNSSPGISAIEGIPSTEVRGLYGGDDDEDNSGVLRYISVRYGGSDIGAGNEINGVTFGGVGSKTTVEYVEVVNNQDDGFEFFGGTVNTRYLISGFNGDDAFDYDEGFRGKGQFWFSLQAVDAGNRAGEHDGGTDPEDGQPYAKPIIVNATYIGSGATSANTENDVVLKIRDNAGGFYYNSIFTDFNGAGLSIEDLASGEDSRARLEAGDLVLANNIWFGFGAGNTIEAIAKNTDWVKDHLTANSNEVVDPLLGSISRTNDGNLDPRPAAGSPALSGAMEVQDPWFVKTAYRGAFSGTSNWARSWSFLDQFGFFAGTSTSVAEAGENYQPESIHLRQNYPNPFNPQTTIAFELTEASTVKLTIYNSLGQQVAVLLDGFRNAGEHKLVWNAGRNASGLFFYTLEAGTQVITRKMVYLR